MPYKDKDKQRACWKRYQQTEKARQTKRLWNQANREKLNAQQRERNQTGRYARHYLKSHLKRSYGLTVEQYEAMVSVQGGKCAICGKVPGNTSHIDGRLHVDHCHDTDRVRDLLCTGCNKGIGQFGDDPELLEKAIAYLRKWKEKHDVSA